MVPYDLASLIYGMGGREAATARLDAFFTQINAGQDKPYAWLGNEPSLNAPWTYLSTGAPWKGQRIIRDALTTLYTDAPDGIPGNDDLGTMSAWYVFCAIGLYPPNPAVRGFDLGAPLFSNVQLDVPGGPRIEIAAPAASTANAYVRGVRLNGKVLSKTWISLPESGTVRLSYDLSASPGSWGSAPADAPPSYSPTAPHFAPSTTARLTAGDTIVHAVPGTRASFHFAVTGDAPGGRVDWKIHAPPGLLASATSGTVDGDGSATAVLAPRIPVAPGVYAVTVNGTASNGALLEPVTVAAAIAPAGVSIPLAYAANYSDDNVTAFDPRTGAVVQNVTTGKNPGDVARSADGSRVYVANQGSNDVSVIDTRLARTMATVKVGKTPASIRLAPGEKMAWVSNNVDGTVQAIDLKTLRAQQSIAVGRSPEQLAIAPDGNTVYAVNQADNTVSIVDVRARRAVATIATGAKPIGIVLSRDGRTAYVANQGSNDVTVFDLGSRRAIGTIAAGVQPQGLALSPGGSSLYVADEGSDTVSVIDLRRRVRVQELRVGLNPAAVALSPDGKTLYAIVMGDNACVKISLDAPQRRTTIDLGNVPIALALP